MYRYCRARAIVVMAMWGCAASTAVASDFSFTGAFGADDALIYLQFVASSPNAVIETWGYGGGTNAGGDIILAGGFDPILTLFDSTGGILNPANVLLDSNNNGTCPPANADGGLCYDAYLAETTLNPGSTYLLVLSQNDNGAVGTTLGDGFSQVGNGNFTGAGFGCPNGQFCDNFANNRTGNWAVDILDVTSAQAPQAVPEPGMALMVFTALGGTLLLRRRHKAKRAK